MGAPAKPFKMALGSLIIKEILGTSDRETVEHIKENPYLQYFIGLTSYTNNAPFDASTLVHFRQKISQETINKINKRIVEQALQTGGESGGKNKKQSQKKDKDKNLNKGKLLLDATCTPADVNYPQDLKLLNEVREKLEKIIDRLYKCQKIKGDKKPRTYRKAARKAYLLIAKKRKVKVKELRKAIKKQLQYVKKNLLSIEQLILKGSSLTWLSKQQYKSLLVAQTIYEQQFPDVVK